MSQVPYEIPSELRDFAEKSVEQARKAFEGFMGAAHKAVSSAESSAFPLPASVKDVSTKAMTFADSNMKAAFDHAQKLVQAKDIQEVLQLQTDYVKAQVATLQEQAKEIGSAVQSSISSHTSKSV